MALRRSLQRILDCSGMRWSRGYGHVVVSGFLLPGEGSSWQVHGVCPACPRVPLCCFQFFSDALLAAACAAFVGIFMFFTSVCAAAAWPLALVILKMFEYVFFAAAGIAASLVLYRVFVCVSAAAARPSALISVEVTDFAFPVRGLGVILKTRGFGACPANACIVKSFWLFWCVLPRVDVGSGPPPPPLCEWDASCQSVPGFGHPALGFFFSAAAACISLAVVIMLWKCCSFCSVSRK